MAFSESCQTNRLHDEVRSLTEGIPALKAPRCTGTRRRIDSEWKVYMATRILIFFAIVGMAVAQSSAQVSMQSSTTAATSFSGSASFGPAHPMGPTVTGAPYSGEEVSENVHPPHAEDDGQKGLARCRGPHPHRASARHGTEPGLNAADRRDNGPGRRLLVHT